MTTENIEVGMGELLDSYDVKRISTGDILKGKVIDVNEKEVSVNINYAFDGLIKREELTTEDLNPVDVVNKDDEIEVYVLSPNDGEGYVSLSRVRALAITEKDDLKKAFKAGTEITVQVKEEVKGGVVAYYGSTRIFIPGSQLARTKVDLNSFVGKEVDIRLIELDFKNRKVVGSRRVIEEEVYEKEQNALWETIKPGEKRTGIVKRLAKFGAFVDIGGIDGLIHLSDLAWERVNKAEDVVSVGDKVEVFVSEVDKEKGRIALVLKDVEKEPWKLHGETIKGNDILEGKVKRVADFGAFVELFPGVEGLVHISEIAFETPAKVSDVLKNGQSVRVKVLSVDLEKRKLSLSIKEAAEKNKDYLQYVDEEEGTTLGDLFKDFKFE